MVMIRFPLSGYVDTSHGPHVQVNGGNVTGLNTDLSEIQLLSEMLVSGPAYRELFS